VAIVSKRAKRQIEKMKSANLTDKNLKLRVIGYTRVSSDEQAEYGSGLDYQAEAIENFAMSQGYDLLAVISDPGISGATLPDKRPGFSQVIAMAEDEKFDVLLVWKFDRLARHLVYAVQTVAWLQEYGVDLRSITEPIDTTSPIGQVIFSVLAGMASMEREAITERTRAGRVKKAERGGYAGGVAPLGYKRTERGLELVEHEAKIVRLIYQLHNQGLSLRAIAKRLTAEGYRTKKNRKWYASTIAAVLDNAKYSGKVEYVFGTVGKYVVSKGEHLPII
jgi:site-specific DNA recombinase